MSELTVHFAPATLNIDTGDQIVREETRVQADWTETDTESPSYIQHKPDLSDVATSGDYDDLTNKPSIPAAQVNADWDAASGVAQILHKPTLATVATSGSYEDLTNKPSIPAAQVNADWDAASGVAQILHKPTLATVATSGSYEDLTNKPSIPAAQVNADWDESDPTSLAYIENRPFFETPLDSMSGQISGMMSYYATTNAPYSGSLTLVEGETYEIHIPIVSGGVVTGEIVFTSVAFSLTGTYSVDLDGVYPTDITFNGEVLLGDRDWIVDHVTTGDRYFSDPSQPLKLFYAYVGNIGDATFGNAWNSATGQEYTVTHGGEIERLPAKYLPEEVTHETWTFTLSDSSTVTKEVMLWQST